MEKNKQFDVYLIQIANFKEQFYNQQKSLSKDLEDIKVKNKIENSF